ncbi:MAG TPA: methylglyoxal synthase [Phycisphaerae bacterium]|nr:methylglyoxal synthase [Phycisphaerae bacterium]HNU45551.1 methylglyoxal synthase [Phycisphaerae bacterium]
MALKASGAGLPPGPRTLIGVLASRDSTKANNALVSLLTYLATRNDNAKLTEYHFLFTGGTYDRVFLGAAKPAVRPLDKSVATWLRGRCGVTRLPETAAGGVVVLSYLITQQQCSIVWPIFGPEEMHWLRPENMALMRLADQWHVKRLMNRGSILTWFDTEAQSDANRNKRSAPPALILRPDLQNASGRLARRKGAGSTQGLQPIPPIPFKPATYLVPRRGKAAPATVAAVANGMDFGDLTVALIAHDEMKARMIEFAIDHEAELKKFGTILATGTTGREVAAATSRKIDEKVYRYHSGPKGGDIEIATEILHDKCHVVIFFVDPLHPHPHAEDIRVVFQACMIKDQVVMITNEMHAREFMSRVVRPLDKLTLYRFA